MGPYPSSATASGPAAADACVAAPGSANGGEKRYIGKIKAFNHQTGFGFINTPEIMAKYGCDVFLNQEVAGGIVIGGIVSFAVEFNKNGKPQARRCVLEEEKPNRDKVQKNAGNSVTSLVGQVHRGRVKSFNAQRGFGFINAMEIQHHFSGRDVYVAKNQAPDGKLQVGQAVEFRLHVDRSGQPQARDIKMVAADSDGSTPVVSNASTGVKFF